MVEERRGGGKGGSRTGEEEEEEKEEGTRSKRRRGSKKGKKGKKGSIPSWDPSVPGNPTVGQAVFCFGNVTKAEKAFKETNKLRNYIPKE